MSKATRTLRIPVAHRRLLNALTSISVRTRTPSCPAMLQQLHEKERLAVGAVHDIVAQHLEEALFLLHEVWESYYIPDDAGTVLTRVPAFPDIPREEHKAYAEELLTVSPEHAEWARDVEKHLRAFLHHFETCTEALRANATPPTEES